MFTQIAFKTPETTNNFVHKMLGAMDKYIKDTFL